MRYSSQLALPGWGDEAQAALARARVIIVGVGAAGSIAALELAAAGVGHLGLVDDGEVALEGLDRQVLHFTPDEGVGKAESAAAKLRFLNPEIVVEAYPARAQEQNAAALVADQGLVIDMSNDEQTRLALNDACCAARVPFVIGASAGMRGVVLPVRPGATACWRCAGETALDDHQPLGAAAALVGGLAAVEAIKLLTGIAESAAGRLLWLDAAAPALSSRHVESRPECPACGSTL